MMNPASVYLLSHKQKEYSFEPKKKYRLFIFDLDGTLADTAEDVHFSMNQLRRELGLPHISLAEAKKSIGPGSDRFIKLLTPNPEQNNLKKMVTIQVA